MGVIVWTSEGWVQSAQQRARGACHSLETPVVFGTLDERFAGERALYEELVYS